MSFTHWLRNLRPALVLGRAERKRSRRPTVRAATHRLELEALEDRCLLSFSPAVMYPAGTGPQAVVTGDFNGDSKLDLGGASNLFVDDGYGYYGNHYYHYEGRVNVLLGNGTGSFSAPIASYLGYGIHTSVAVADFNGDGKQDFAAANYD